MKRRNNKINGFKHKKLKGNVIKLSPKLIKRDENVRYIPFCKSTVDCDYKKEEMPEQIKEGKAYIPICVYSWHIGIIKDETPCKIGGCKHYDKFYL